MRWIAIITGDSPDALTLHGLFRACGGAAGTARDALRFDSTLQR